MKQIFIPDWRGTASGKINASCAVSSDVIGMVMMCYILRYLASMPRLKEMPGGSTMTMILDLGFLVLALLP